MSDGFGQVIAFLPAALRESAFGLSAEKRSAAEEVRLRAGRAMRVVLGTEEHVLPDAPVVTPEDLDTVLEMASEHSVHTALDRMRGGFITVRGGHRIGICGEAITEQGKIIGFRRLFSLNLRIAKEIWEAAAGLAPLLLEGDRLANTLVIAPPGAGKTTLLRDLIRRISAGEGIKSQRIGVADERGELASLWNGIPQLDLGPQTDILDGAAKAEGMMLLLRGMNPQILAVDEITHPDDLRAIGQAAFCGVSVLATVHGRSLEELRERSLLRELMEQKLFSRAVLLERDGDGKRTWKVEEIKC